MKLVRNLLALASAQDLLGRIASLQIAVERLEADRALQREYGELVAGTVLRRHYGGDRLPPPHLRTHVGPNDQALDFWAKGMRSSERVLEVFGEEPTAPILDWGCGSGRTLTWLRCYPAWLAQYHGCDVDSEAIAWLRSQGEPRVEVCDDLPPLPYPDDFFGGVFAISVLTHIPSDRHRAWYEELRRVLRPGGRAFFTTQGTLQALREPAFVSDEFRRVGHAYRPGPGHYKNASFVSEAFTRRALDGLLDVSSYVEDGFGDQVAILAQKPGG